MKTKIFRIRERLRKVYKADQCTDRFDTAQALKQLDEIGKLYTYITGDYNLPNSLRNRIRSINIKDQKLFNKRKK